MRKGFILFLIVTFLPLVVKSQQRTDELVLTGSILGVSGMADSSQGEDAFSFNIQLYLQIRNNSDQSLIVFRPDRFMGQRKVEFLKNDLTGGFGVGVEKTLPWVNPTAYLDYDPFSIYVKRVESATEPFKDGFLTIEPASYFEFRDSFTVDSGYKFDPEKLESLKKMLADRGIETTRIGLGNLSSEFPALKVEYYLTFAKRHPDAEFLKTVQKRWKKFGKLYLTNDGDFRLKSEAIVNKTTP